MLLIHLKFIECLLCAMPCAEGLRREVLDFGCCGVLSLMEVASIHASSCTSERWQLWCRPESQRTSQKRCLKDEEETHSGPAYLELLISAL